MKKFGVSIIGCFMFFSCAGQRPENLGVHYGKLADCPGKPNCVSSQVSDKAHFVAPITYQEEKLAAFMRLKRTIESIKNTTIIKETENYLRIECKSAMMGFVDDMEFYFPEEKVIHLRSASRIGSSDFGVNRKRAEKIHKLFNAEANNEQK